MNRRQFIVGAGSTAVAAAVAGPLIVHGIGTHRLEQRMVRLALGLTRPLRVVALGDIHYDPLYEQAYMERIVADLNAIDADLIVYTGDFVTHKVHRVHELAGILGRAESRLGSFATLGNHDCWTGSTAVVDALEKNGIRVLRNHCVPLPDQDEVYLSGLDSFWSGYPNPSVLSLTPAGSKHILLVHEPDPFQILTDTRIVLQISGHTHGGQVRLPMIGAICLPKFGVPFQEGLYTRDGRHLYVNRGIGTLLPHVRFNCLPEITVFDLT